MHTQCTQAFQGMPFFHPLGNAADATQRGNPHLRQQSWFQNSRFAGRQAMVTQLAGRSPINGRTEVVTIYTTQLRNGETFYFAAVAPDDEASRYNTAFRTMLNSIRLNDTQL